MARSPDDSFNSLDSLFGILMPREQQQIPQINLPPKYSPGDRYQLAGDIPEGPLGTPRRGIIRPETGPGALPSAQYETFPHETLPGGGGRFPDFYTAKGPLWQHEVPGTERITAPMIRNPASPLFDYSPSTMRQRPNVPQFDLPRYVPPKGVPESALRLDTPANMRRLRNIAEQGAKIGGLEWYNMDQLKQLFISELGHNYGNALFEQYLGLLGATSPRTRVSENVRNASYYYKALITGEPTPERYLKGGHWRIKKETQAPYPYGMMPIHVQNVENIKAGGLPVLQNPKPPSFIQNLAGNWQPVTIDVHNLRLLSGQREGRDAPSPTEYGYLEQIQQEQARRLGMDPAQWQASLWLGGAQQTGVKSGTDPMLKHFERRVEHTAEQRGQTKQQVLMDFIHGRAPLLLKPDVSEEIIQ
jgi:hypothetical protein